MKITRVGVDIAKNIFHIHATDRHGVQMWQAKLARSKWLEAMSKHLEPGCEVAMEACGASHYWARELHKRGFNVKLIAAQFVKPYVKSNKNDRADAAAIAEALSRPDMRFVKHKTIAQQDMQAMHRVRSERVRQRTAKANQIRGLVGEYGLVAPMGINQLRRAVPLWLEDAQNGLTANFRSLLEELRQELVNLDALVETGDKHIAQAVKSDPVATRLLSLRGVGPLSASALAIALGDGTGFKKGREFAASLGLVPRQHSTGGRDQLLSISKRGDSYLRTLLVHGARSVLRFSANKEDNLSRWLQTLSNRKHKNVVTVALANKTARTAWALVRNEQDYDPSMMAASIA